MSSHKSRMVFSLVSVLTAIALSAHAEEPPKIGGAGKPAVAPKAAPGHPAGAVGGHPQGPVAGRPGPTAGRPGPAPGGPAVGRGPVGRGDARFAHGPMPTRNFGGDAYRGHLAWEGGRWHHEVRNGRDGWWWDVGGVWYYYPQPMDGPPAYVSEDFVDDGMGPPPDEAPVADAYAPPPGAYAPPPPPPADPGASAVGGAIVGGLLGGLLTGRASGAAAGAVIGGASGAIAGATAAARPGYYLAQGNCYYRYPSGQYVQADPRACY